MIGIATTAAPVLALHQPAPWIVLDCETGDAPESAVEAAIDAWKAPSNWKAETVEKKRQEHAEKARDKAALLDASPILCMGLMSNRWRIMLNGMNGERPEIPGWDVWPTQSERGLLLALRALFNDRTAIATILGGHNVRGFDLPKLRGAFVRNGLRLPEILRPAMRGDEACEVIDTASLIKAFSMELRDEFCPSLDEVCRVLGIPLPKTTISGADVPRLHREGGHTAEILTYCAIDCEATTRAFLLLTGQAEDLQ